MKKSAKAAIGLFLSACSVGMIAHAQLDPLPAIPIDRPEGVFHNKAGTGELICVPIPPNPGDDWFRSLAWDQRMFGTRGPCDPDLEYIDEGTWGRTVLLSGVDSAGRRADFRFYVLNETYAWALGSASRIEGRGRAANFDALLATEVFFRRFCSADAALGLGAASYEGETAANHRLSGARADVISQQVSRVAPRCTTSSTPDVYSVNLGEHAETPDANTADQRKVVIVLMRNAQEGVNIGEALKDAVGDQELVDGFALKYYDLLQVSSYQG